MGKRRTARTGIPLAWLLAILLSVAGCSLLNPSEPSGVQPTSGTAETSGSGTSSAGTSSAGTSSAGTSGASSSAPGTSTAASASASVSESTSSAATATATDTTPTTGAATTAGTSTAAPTSAASTAAPTASPTTVRPTTTASADLSKLSLTARSWSYNRPASTSLFKDIRVTIPSAAATLIAPWSVIWQARPASQKTVYLTMDEGYEFETNTSEILDIAASRNVRIAFFITGSYLRSQPALVRRMLAEGHLVLNHTDTHPNLAALYAEKGAAAVMASLQKLETEYRVLTGQSMRRYVRPPSGAYSERLLGLLKQNGYRTVFWSFAYRDWLTAEQPDPADALRAVLGELHDGSVILLHAVSNTNVAILPQVIDGIRARGYRIGSLTDIP